MDSLRLVASLQSSSTDDALQTGHQQRTPSVLGSIDLYSELSEALKKKWDEHDEPEWDSIDLLALVQDSVELLWRRVYEASSEEHEYDQYLMASAVSVHCIRQLPLGTFLEALRQVMFVYGLRALDIRQESPIKMTNIPDQPHDAEKRLVQLLCTVNQMAEIELETQKVWGKILLALHEEYVFYTVTLNRTELPTAQNLVARVKDEFEAMAYRVTSASFSIHSIAVGFDWSEKALDALSNLRCHRLCAMIATGRELVAEAWDPDEIEDLREGFSRPNHRQDIIDQIRQTLLANLLNPGVSTVRILDTYMRIIDFFKLVDPSGVILPLIAPDMKDCLRARFAVGTIVRSLLEGSHNAEGRLKTSTEDFSLRVALCMNNTDYEMFKEYYEGSDYHDLGWIPDPIDAIPDHRTARRLDAMAHLMRIDSKDVIRNELQSALSERLLRSDDDKFDNEMRLLATFKQRFRNFDIQQAEVMLRDVTESQRLNHDVAQQVKALFRDPSSSDDLDFQAKILSPHFWPELTTTHIKLPEQIEHAAGEYAAEFQNKKSGRRLEWLEGQGGATVELELADRTVVEHVATWQAAVIYAFSSPRGSSFSSDEPASLTVDQLVSHLQLHEHYVRAALAFWTGKMVLQPSPHRKDLYIILEHLPSRDASSTETTITAAAQEATASIAASHATDAAPTLKSAAEVLQDRKALYSSCVVAMLTNNGDMDAGRILMFLGAALPGGFPFEEAELVRFLGGLAEEGLLEGIVGGEWRVRRR